MASFDKNFADYEPFGKNEYLHSTVGCKFDSFTVAKDSVPSVVIDGSTEKVLQSGVLLAKITSGPMAGKYGPYTTDATNGLQTTANIVGINDTFTPWQLLRRDKVVAALYIGTVKQARCFMVTGGVFVPVTDAVFDAMRGTKTLDITAH
jgi:hypothetical protein